MSRRNQFKMNAVPGLLCAAVVALAACATATAAQTRPANLRTVIAVAPAKRPLPPEETTADSTRFSFIFYGGMRGREDGVEIAFEHALVVQFMLDTIESRRTGPDPIRFILSNGDAVYDGREARQWNVSWAPIVDRLTTEGGLPFFMAPGNHDVTESANTYSSGRRQGLTNYFRAVAELIPPDGHKRRLAGYPTYAVAYGNTFAIAFDSNIAADQKQFDWVKAQLEGLDRNRYTNVIAYCHHPAFSSGPHGYPIIERPIASLRTKWMPLLRKHNVRLLLAGHDHLYEHWTERYHDETGWHRLDHIVSGGGGSPLYTFRGEPDLNAYLGAGVPDSLRLDHIVSPGAKPSDNPYHFTVIHVDGDQLSLEVIGLGSDFRPYGTARVSLNDPKPQP